MGTHLRIPTGRTGREDGLAGLADEIAGGRPESATQKYTVPGINAGTTRETRHGDIGYGTKRSSTTVMNARVVGMMTSGLWRSTISRETGRTIGGARTTAAQRWCSRPKGGQMAFRFCATPATSSSIFIPTNPATRGVMQ